MTRRPKLLERSADLKRNPPASSFNRRHVLTLMGALPVLMHGKAYAQSQKKIITTHGLSAFGDLKYPADFQNFAYVNKNAPIGGTLSFLPSQWVLNQNPRTFNTFNSYVLEGDASPLMELTFCSLMTRAYDEPDAVYGQLATSVQHNEERTLFEFTLFQGAVFHDDTPITADDVVFSFKTLLQQGHPMLASTLAQVETCEAVDKTLLRVTLKPNAPRDVILTFAADMPVFSKAYYSKTPFKEGSLTPPLGSGPFKVGAFSAGRFVEFERVTKWWGWPQPAMRGQYNWNKVRIEFYRDHDVAFEAFKAGQYFLREEFSSKLWATAYDFPALKAGQVVQLSIADRRPSGMQGFFINMRRDKLKDPRVRRALSLVFDFEWSNKNLFYGAYQRTQSPFQNSRMMATGKPPADELALLTPLRGRVPDDVFGDVFTQPVSDGSGRDRKLMVQAMRLLAEAGIKRKGTKTYLPDGSVFTLEFLNENPGYEKIILPYIGNLRAIGIEATLRTVDPAQFQLRTNDYDFDMVTQRYSLSLTPGDGLKRVFSSKDASRPGTYNLSGLKHPVVDEMIEKIIAAPDRATLEVTCRALDRILRSLHFWVPQWYKASHSISHWNIYDAPEAAPYFASGILETWWVNQERAKKHGKGQ